MSMYITKQGDMWDSIAFQQLGSTSYTDKLMNLNAQYIDYYIFPAGVTLELPDVAPKKSDKLPPWKRVSG